jgi:RNA-directed DNA polymerase
MLEGNTGSRVMASGCRRPGVEGPFALHIMSTRQPVRSQRLLFGVETNHVAASMRVRAEEARSANGAGKSDSRIVPQQPTCQVGETKPGNSGGGKAAKLSRERDRTPAVHSGGSTVNQRLDRITQRAEQQPEEVFNNLYSLLTYDLLEQAFRRLKRDKAPGIDGVTVDQYEANLRVNLLDLETRLHRQSYLATKKVNWISDADIKGFFDHVLRP